MSHVCHAHGGEISVPPRMFMCRGHWYALPAPVRDAIWAEYRPGQENDKNPSNRYLAVQRFAVGRLVFKPNDQKRAEIAAVYLLEAEGFRQAAIAAGNGDPLEGLLA